MQRGVDYFRGLKLTGVAEIEGRAPCDQALILCSGPTFAEYDDSIAPRTVPRFSINETIETLGENADFWVISDIPIVEKYARYVHSKTVILSMHRSSEVIHDACPENRIYTVQSMGEAVNFDNPYQFYSRRTVMIGAVELGRWIGFKNFYCFGLDLFRTKDKYYFDGKDSNWMGERSCSAQHEIRNKRWNRQRIYQTPNLRAAKMALAKVCKVKLWAGVSVSVVNSPESAQEFVPKMTMEKFKEEMGSAPVADERPVLKKKPGRPKGSKNKPKVRKDEAKSISRPETEDGRGHIEEQSMSSV